MTEKINNISQIIRSTEEYSDVCDMCRDEILLYPTISGRTNYTQKEVEEITLKRIIGKLQAKEQECEELKDKNQYLINTYCHFKNEIKKYKKAVHKYKVVFQDKIKRLHLSRREFLKEINSVPVKIACDIENFKNALNNFNNAIQVINNEDNYKQALDEIENYVRDNSDFDKSDKLTSNTGAYDILDIISKVKAVNNAR